MSTACFLNNLKDKNISKIKSNVKNLKYVGTDLIYNQQTLCSKLCQFTLQLR